MDKRKSEKVKNKHKDSCNCWQEIENTRKIKKEHDRVRMKKKKRKKITEIEIPSSKSHIKDERKYDL